MNGYGVSQQSYDEQVARNAALKEEIEQLQKQLKDALQNSEYAWKNTNLIEKDRQRLMKENDTLKELIKYLEIVK